VPGVPQQANEGRRVSEPISITSIKIDEDGRYLIVFKSHKPLSTPAAERFRNQCEDISKRISNWWASGEKFLMLAVDDTVNIELERVDGQG
jgi:hypothetical protein